MKTHETATPVRAFDRAYINGGFGHRAGKAPDNDDWASPSTMAANRFELCGWRSGTARRLRPLRTVLETILIELARKNSNATPQNARNRTRLC